MLISLILDTALRGLGHHAHKISYLLDQTLGPTNPVSILTHGREWMLRGRMSMVCTEVSTPCSAPTGVCSLQRFSKF